MAHRSNYWSCSKFADWLRGNPKPKAETSEGWDAWYKFASASHPVRYWIAEEALDAIQNFIWWPVDKLYDIKYYINNRWVTRTHALTAHPRDIPRGEWRDVGNRFLPCLFNELVDFVEIELAWHHIAWDEEARAKYSPPFWARGWFRWRTWRCAEAGLDSLEWQRRLTMGDDNWRGGDVEDPEAPTPQAVNAQEILDLYNWWTQVYPNRPDPYDASGWSALMDEEREANGGKLHIGNIGKESPSIRKRMNQAHKVIDRMEKEYQREDEQMMIRLIRIRHALWT